MRIIQPNHQYTAVSSRTGPLAWCDHENSTDVKFLRALHSALRARNRTGDKNRTGPVVGCDWGITQDVLGRCKKRYQFLLIIQKDNYILHILRFLGIISSAWNILRENERWLYHEWKHNLRKKENWYWHGCPDVKKNYITIALLRRAITSLFILYDIQASISGFHFLEMPSFTFIVTPAFFVAISFQIYAFCQHNFSAFTDLYWRMQYQTHSPRRVWIALDQPPIFPVTHVCSRSNWSVGKFAVKFLGARLSSTTPMGSQKLFIFVTQRRGTVRTSLVTVLWGIAK